MQLKPEKSSLKTVSLCTERLSWIEHFSQTLIIQTSQISFIYSCSLTLTHTTHIHTHTQLSKQVKERLKNPDNFSVFSVSFQDDKQKENKTLKHPDIKKQWKFSDANSLNILQLSLAFLPLKTYIPPSQDKESQPSRLHTAGELLL